MPWLAAAAAGSSIAGGLIGAADNASARDQAKQAYDQSVADLNAIGIPSIEAQQLVMEEYKSQGKWTPELEQAVQLGPSNMSNITTDPAYKQASLKALGSLQGIGDSGGMTLSDRSNLEGIESSIAAKNRGAREAILQDAQQRGGYGSGTSVAAQLLAQQQGANEAHQAGLQTAGNAQARALAAIQAAGQLGGNLQGQEFGQKSQQASAADEIAKWNAANQQQVQGTNVGVQNQASQYNLANAQNLANANVDTRNKEQAYNKSLYQQQYQNQMQQASAKANARAGQATNALAAGQQAATAAAGVGSGVNQAITAYGQQQNNNENAAADRDMKKQIYGGLATQN